MANQKYYLYRSVAAPYMPSTKNGTWADSTATVTGALGPSSSATEARTPASSKASLTSSGNIMLGRWSAALPGNNGGTIAFTSAFLNMYESSTSADMFTQIHAWVCSPTGELRGVVVTATGTSELVTSASSTTMGRNVTASVSNTISYSAGDYIVLEAGVKKNNATSSYTANMTYGYYNTFADASVSGRYDANPNITFDIVQTVVVPAPPNSITALSTEYAPKISITASPTTGASAPTSYKLYRGSVAGSPSYITDINVGQEYFDLSVPSSDTLYFYSATALNSAGESVKTSEVTAQKINIPGLTEYTNVYNNPTSFWGYSHNINSLELGYTDGTNFYSIYTSSSFVDNQTIYVVVPSDIIINKPIKLYINRYGIYDDGVNIETPVSFVNTYPDWLPVDVVNQGIVIRIKSNITSTPVSDGYSYYHNSTIESFKYDALLVSPVPSFSVNQSDVSLRITWDKSLSNDATGFKLYYKQWALNTAEPSTWIMESFPQTQDYQPILMFDNGDNFKAYIVAFNDNGDANPSAVTTYQVPTGFLHYGILPTPDWVKTGGDTGNATILDPLSQSGATNSKLTISTTNKNTTFVLNDTGVKHLLSGADYPSYGSKGLNWNSESNGTRISWIVNDITTNTAFSAGFSVVDEYLAPAIQSTRNYWSGVDGKAWMVKHLNDKLYLVSLDFIFSISQTLSTVSNYVSKELMCLKPVQAGDTIVFEKSDIAFHILHGYTVNGTYQEDEIHKIDLPTSLPTKPVFMVDEANGTVVVNQPTLAWTPLRLNGVYTVKDTETEMIFNFPLSDGWFKARHPQTNQQLIFLTNNKTGREFDILDASTIKDNSGIASMVGRVKHQKVGFLEELYMNPAYVRGSKGQRAWVVSPAEKYKNDYICEGLSGWAVQEICDQVSSEGNFTNVAWIHSQHYNFTENQSYRPRLSICARNVNITERARSLNIPIGYIDDDHQHPSIIHFPGTGQAAFIRAGWHHGGSATMHNRFMRQSILIEDYAGSLTFDEFAGYEDKDELLTEIIATNLEQLPDPSTVVEGQTLMASYPLATSLDDSVNNKDATTYGNVTFSEGNAHIPLGAYVSTPFVETGPDGSCMVKADFKVNDMTSETYLISNSGADTSQIIASYLINGQIYVKAKTVVVENGQQVISWPLLFVTGAIVSSNTWFNVKLSVAGNERKVTLYVDDVKVGSAIHPAATLLATSHAWYFGNNQGYASIDVNLKNVDIYDNHLETTLELNDTLQAQYLFNEAAGASTINDEKGSNDLVRYNGTTGVITNGSYIENNGSASALQTPQPVPAAPDGSFIVKFDYYPINNISSWPIIYTHYHKLITFGYHSGYMWVFSSSDQIAWLPYDAGSFPFTVNAWNTVEIGFNGTELTFYIKINDVKIAWNTWVRNPDGTQTGGWTTGVTDVRLNNNAKEGSEDNIIYNSFSWRIMYLTSGRMDNLEFYAGYTEFDPALALKPYVENLYAIDLHYNNNKIFPTTPKWVDIPPMGWYDETNVFHGKGSPVYTKAATLSDNTLMLFTHSETDNEYEGYTGFFEEDSNGRANRVDLWCYIKTPEVSDPVWDDSLEPVFFDNSTYTDIRHQENEVYTKADGSFSHVFWYKPDNTYLGAGGTSVFVRASKTATFDETNSLFEIYQTSSYLQFRHAGANYLGHCYTNPMPNEQYYKVEIIYDAPRNKFQLLVDDIPVVFGAWYDQAGAVHVSDVTWLQGLSNHVTQQGIAYTWQYLHGAQYKGSVKELRWYDKAVDISTPDPVNPIDTAAGGEQYLYKNVAAASDGTTKVSFTYRPSDSFEILARMDSSTAFENSSMLFQINDWGATGAYMQLYFANDNANYLAHCDSGYPFTTPGIDYDVEIEYDGTANTFKMRVNGNLVNWRVIRLSDGNISIGSWTTVPCLSRQASLKGTSYWWYFGTNDSNFTSTFSSFEFYDTTASSIPVYTPFIPLSTMSPGVLLEPNKWTWGYDNHGNCMKDHIARLDLIRNLEATDYADALTQIPYNTAMASKGGKWIQVALAPTEAWIGGTAENGATYIYVGKPMAWPYDDQERIGVPFRMYRDWKSAFSQYVGAWGLYYLYTKQTLTENAGDKWYLADGTEVTLPVFINEPFTYTDMNDVPFSPSWTPDVGDIQYDGTNAGTATYKYYPHHNQDNVLCAYDGYIEPCTSVALTSSKNPILGFSKTIRIDSNKIWFYDPTFNEGITLYPLDWSPGEEAPSGFTGVWNVYCSGVETTTFTVNAYTDMNGYLLPSNYDTTGKTEGVDYLIKTPGQTVKISAGKITQEVDGRGLAVVRWDAVLETWVVVDIDEPGVGDKPPVIQWGTYQTGYVDSPGRQLTYPTFVRLSNADNILISNRDDNSGGTLRRVKLDISDNGYETWESKFIPQKGITVTTTDSGPEFYTYYGIPHTDMNELQAWVFSAHRPHSSIYIGGWYGRLDIYDLTTYAQYTHFDSLARNIGTSLGYQM